MARTKAEETSKREVVTKSGQAIIPKKQIPAPAKKRRFSQKVRAHREIKKAQRGTDLLVPKASMSRLIKEVLKEVADEMGMEPTRITKNAMHNLREASENFLIETMQLGTMLQTYSKRDTLTKRDLKFSSYLMNRIYSKNQ